LAEADAKAQQKLSEEGVKAATDLAETKQQLVKLADRSDRLLVRAPQLTTACSHNVGFGMESFPLGFYEPYRTTAEDAPPHCRWSVSLCEM
jgi:hypothetical protein